MSGAPFNKNLCRFPKLARIVDSDGTSQIVKLKDPLALPPPSERSEAEPTG